MVRRRTRILVVLAALAPLALLLNILARAPAGGPLRRALTLDGAFGAVCVDAGTGRAFVAGVSRDHSVVAVLDTRSGATVRTVAVPGPLLPPGYAPYGTPFLLDARGGRVFALAAIRGAPVLEALDARTGAPRRAIPLGVANQTMVDALAVDARTGRVFVAVTDVPPRPAHALLTLEAASGRPLRTTVLPLRADALAVDARTGRVLAGDQVTMGLAVLDAASGRLLRAAPGRYPESDTALDFRADPWGLAIDARRDRVFFGGFAHGDVRVFDARDGRPLRAIATGQRSVTQLAVDARSGRALALGERGVAVLDAARGRPLRTVAVRGLQGLLAVDARAGRVLAPADRAVRVLDARDGRPRRAVPVPGVAVVAVAGEGLDRAYALGDRGQVWALDVARGRLTRALTLPGVRFGPNGATGGYFASYALGLDAGAGRLVALGYRAARPARPPDPWGWAPPWLRRLAPFIPRPAPTPPPAGTGDGLGLGVFDTTR